MMTPEDKLKRIRTLWYEERNSIADVYERQGPYMKEEWEEVIKEMNWLLEIIEE